LYRVPIPHVDVDPTTYSPASHVAYETHAGPATLPV
jgi:hypothetical protein